MEFPEINAMCFSKESSDPRRVKHSKHNGFTQKYYHFHRFHELVYIAEGTGWASAGSLREELRTPCLLLYPAYVYHVTIAVPGTVYDRYMFWFYSEKEAGLTELRPDLRELYARPLRQLPLDAAESDWWRSFFETLAAETDVESCMLYRLVALRRLQRIGAERLGGQPSGEKAVYIRELIERLERDFREPVTADSLAAEYFISRAKLNRDFRAYTGMTLREYVTLVRVEHAKELLLSGSPVLRTAVECGYANESHFIRIFRRLLGCTPYQFVKNSR